jgi:cytochrome oxidase Cu insertion factor (SCO1/SenC/PrrC family)
VRRLTILSLSAAAAAGIVIGAALHGRLGGGTAAALPATPALPLLHGQATWPSGKRPAPAFTLRDQNGRRVSLASLRGGTVVLMFEDSLCKLACPLEGKMTAAAIRQVPAARRPRVVVVSVDPAGDTSRTIAVAVHKWRLPRGSGVTWLVGTRAELRPVWRAYGIEVLPVRGDIVHSTALYVIDRRGDERAGFLVPFVPGLLADDLGVIGREA